MIDPNLLKILACPACKGSVELKENKIICTKCKKKYPIKDGIPIMLIEEAKDDEKNKVLDIGCGFGFFLKQFLTDRLTVLGTRHSVNNVRMCMNYIPGLQ